MAEVFDIGDTVRLKVDFTVIDEETGQKVLTDPTTVVCKVYSPTGVTTTPSYVRLSQGKFKVEFIVNQPGTWYFRWEGTGAVQATEPGEFYVRKAAF